MFPASSRVLLMSQDMAHVDPAAVEVDGRDQPVLVSADVEHNPITDLVRAGKCCTQLVEAMEVCLFHRLEPAHPCSLAVRVTYPELTQRFTGDDVHEKIVSRLEIIGKWCSEAANFITFDRPSSTMTTRLLSQKGLTKGALYCTL